MATRQCNLARAFWIRCGVASIMLGAVTSACVAWALSVLVDLPTAPIPGVVMPVDGRVSPARLLWTDFGWLDVQETRGFGAARRTVRFQHIHSPPIYPSAPDASRPTGVVGSLGTRPDGVAWGWFSRLPIHEWRRWEDVSATEDVRGWPWPCLASRIEADSNGLWTAREGYIVGRVATTESIFSPEAVPIGPIWTGLALDTLAYAALWSVPLALFVGLRAVRRARRGWCARCGYDVGGEHASGCPECGWARQSESASAGIGKRE